MKKIKILTLGDHPLTPSGVGIQTKYMVEGLLKTGKYSVISLGGAINHVDATPVVTEEWGEDWKIFPVGGTGKNNEVFGTPEIVRSVLRTERPDIIWFMTDPHWWKWLWQIEDEIRPLVPMVYYHVWDNYPIPDFNKNYYESSDLVVSSSKLTSEIVKAVAPEVKELYIPHTVDTEIFKKIPDDKTLAYKINSLGEESKDKVIYFWNNRNSRRKHGASVLWWFKEFLDEVGQENACLIMHTDPEDKAGPNLAALLHSADITDGQVMISSGKYAAEQLATVYNIADCTINIADAEGFGLSTLESLACETPIIVNMTGGLQEQVTDGKEYFGIGIEPSTKTLVGSQNIPYIYEDRVSKENFIAALHKVYNMTKAERDKLGSAGRKHVLKNYNIEKYCKQWDEILTSIYYEKGSWDNRTQYKSWRVIEL